LLAEASFFVGEGEGGSLWWNVCRLCDVLVC